MSEATPAVAAPETPAAPAAPAAPAEASNAAPKPAESAAATPPGEKPATPDPTAEKRGQSRFERRISRLHREAAEARAERDLLRKQLEESRPRPANDAGAPRLEEFQDIQEYAKAYGKYEADKAIKEHTAKQQSETQKQYQARLEKEWSDRAERGADKYDDWEEKVGDLKPTEPWSVAIMEAENGDDVAHYLATHWDEAERITKLSPVAQIREIGRLEQKLLANPPVKPQAPSQAPAPVAPLKGTTPAEPASIKDTGDMGKWVELRRSQLRAKRGR